MPDFVVDIEWPLAGMKVAKEFKASVVINTEDESIRTTDDYTVKCVLTENCHGSKDFHTSTFPYTVTVPVDANLCDGTYDLTATLTEQGSSKSLGEDTEMGVIVDDDGPAERPAIIEVIEEAVLNKNRNDKSYIVTVRSQTEDFTASEVYGWLLARSPGRGGMNNHMNQQLVDFKKATYADDAWKLELHANGGPQGNQFKGNIVQVVVMDDEDIVIDQCSRRFRGK